MPKIRLRILTPARALYDNDIDMVVLRTTEGEMAVLPGHTPLSAVLVYCDLRIKNGEETIHAAIMSGFVEVTPECVTIMSDAAEWPEEIDVVRAEAARERARKRIEQGDGDEVDIERARLAIRRAMIRLEVSGYRTKN